MLKLAITFLGLSLGTAAFAQQATPGTSGGAYCATQAVGNNTTLCASTAFVNSSISAIPPQSVANNTALAALSTATNPTTARLGYAAAGDGGYAIYTPSLSACSLNAGNGDNGSQVKSANSGCWLIDPIATPLNPFQFGAKGDGATNDYAAFAAEVAASIRLKVALTFGQAPVSWKINTKLTIDYASVASTGWSINANGAYFDTSGITSGVNFGIYCGGTPGVKDSNACAGLVIRGPLQIRGSTANDFIFQLGYPDLRDVNQGVIIEKLIVANGSTDSRAGGCQFNFPTTDDIYAVCDTNGGGGLNTSGYAAGATIVASSMSIWRGASTGYWGTLIDDSVSASASNNVSNVFIVEDREVGNTAFAVRTSSMYFVGNTFIGPWNASPRAFNIPCGANIYGNRLVNANYSGQPSFTRGTACGVEVEGHGNQPLKTTPYGTAYTIDGLDSNSVISSYNASAGGAETNLFPISTTSSGTTLNITTTGILGTYLVSGVCIAPGTTVSSITDGAHLVLSAPVSCPVTTSYPIDFRPPSAGGGGSTMTITLKDCTTLNGTAGWSAEFMPENSNPITLSPSGGQQIVVDGQSLGSLSLVSNYEKAKLTCNGSYWTLDSPSPKVAADNGIGVRTSWTPTLKLGATIATTSVASGYCTVNGRQGRCEFSLTATNLNGGVGNVTITGMPYTSLLIGTGVVGYSGNTVGVGGTILTTVSGGTSTIQLLYQAGTGTGALTQANMSATVVLQGGVDFIIQ